MFDFFEFIVDLFELLRSKACRFILLIISLVVIAIGLYAVYKGNSESGFICAGIGAAVAGILFLIGSNGKENSI